MMYYIMEARVTDRDAYAATVAQWLPKARAAEQHGARIKIAGGHVETVVGDWKPKNLLVIEFPDKDALAEWMGSGDHAEVVELVGQSADVRAVTVAGL